MEIYKSLVSLKNSCVGLGYFDGVHLGHQALLTRLVETAKNNNLKSVVLTFKESPAKIFSSAVKYISFTKERESFFETLGIDAVVELDFDETLMNMDAETYLKEVIYNNFSPKYVFSGFNHTFGKNKLGTSKVLSDNQAKYNYTYIEIPPVMHNEHLISSSFIKKCISEGDIELANTMLGHNFKIEGIVKEGDKIGKSIGFPTANIDYPQDKEEIPYGVYCAQTIFDNKVYKSILNYGNKPTINSQNVKPVAEVHIIGFNKNIYGQHIEVSLGKRLRSETKFESVSQLKQQIIKDIELC